MEPPHHFWFNKEQTHLESPGIPGEVGLEHKPRYEVLSNNSDLLLLLLFRVLWARAERKRKCQGAQKLGMFCAVNITVKPNHGFEAMSLY